MNADTRDYPIARLEFLEGKRLVTVAVNPNADEGFIFTFDDGSILEVGFSGYEGSIEVSRGFE